MLKCVIIDNSVMAHNIYI